MAIYAQTPSPTPTSPGQFQVSVVSGGTPPSSQKWLRRINNVLLIVVILTNVYVISVPFLPQLLFAAGKQSGQQQKLEQKLTQPTVASSGSTPTTTPTAQGNHIIIPSMILDQPVVEGTNMYRALDQGVWRWPGGSTPDKGGNTVMLAHRFTYTKPKGVFYFLDKVRTGDSVGVVWNNVTYVYKVTNTKVVHPTQTEILSPTKTPTLTLYTCTPLWLPKDRLVVTAELQPDPVNHPELDKQITQ